MPVISRRAPYDEVAGRPPIRVAVVDDHPIVREGLVSVLRRSRTCRPVCEAGSVAAARHLLAKAAPEVVIVDLKIPDGGGPPLVRELLRMLPASKLLVLTAYEEVGVAREVLRLGAHGYLLKGASGEQVISAVCQVAAGRRIIDPALAGLLWDLQVYPRAPTERELEVLQRLVDGCTNKEIADALRVSPDTVKFHVKNLFRRLEVRTRTEAVIAATRLGYLELQR